MLLIIHKHLELLGRSGLLSLKLGSGDFVNLVCGRALYIHANFSKALSIIKSQQNYDGDVQRLGRVTSVAEWK